MSLQGNISLYGPGCTIISMLGLREALRNWDWLAAASNDGASMVPFGNGCPILRSCSHGKVEEKSVHLGMDTEHNHSLYDAAQSSQLFASEY